MNRRLPSLYLITDRQQVRAPDHYFEVIEELLAAGLGMLQLREKDLPAAELYRYAVKLRDLTDKYGSLLLINDRIDIARAVSADGVQLGKMSLPLKAARDQLGQEAIIGVSTHSLEEARTAQHDGASFITYGPVFYTPSKAPYGAPVGVESLRQACAAVSIPVYALGGVKYENIDAIRATGIHGIAAISALIGSSAPAQDFRRLRDNFTYDRK